jgi:hypothetical protein
LIIRFVCSFSLLHKKTGQFKQFQRCAIIAVIWFYLPSLGR